MSRVTDREIELKIRKAVENTAPDGLSKLLSEIDDRKGAVNIVEKTGKRRNRWIGIVAACLALVLVAGAGGFYYGENYSVATVVSLDVNPSIELKVNRNEKVLSCKGLNAEGQDILASMGGGADLEGAKVSVAVNAIVGAIVKSGYLDSLSSAILISVEDNDTQRGASLQAKLVAEVDGVLQTASSSAGVLSQSMTVDADLNKQAQQNNISSGKAAYINQVIALNPSLEFDRLAQLTVEELRDLIRLGAPAMPIGKSEASRIVGEYAGVLELDSPTGFVDPELDDVVPNYEVDIFWNGREYEYMVDAFTGEIISGQPDITSQEQPAPSGTSAGTATALSSDDALNAALAYFGEKHPELAGQEIAGKRVEYDREDNNYDVEFWCSGYEFDYDVDASTGSVRREDTRYVKPADPGTTGGQGSGTSNTGTPGTGSTTAPNGDIGADAAKEAALKKAGVSASDAVWLKCQREYDDGRLEYEIELYSGSTEYDITVDAATGEIIKYETELIDLHHDDDHHSTGTTTQTSDIGADAAKSAAFTHAGITEGQATRVKCERDYDDGRLVYEVEFKSNGYEYEYKIDASTGSILEHEKDRDD